MARVPSLAPAALVALAAALGPGTPAARAALLPDSRGWEMVSPVDKNGGEVASPGGAAGALAGAGVLQAAQAGGAVAYASPASFGEAEGAAPISQYLATRGAGGWSTENLTPPLLSGTYEGDPYLAFSEDLSRAIVSSGWSCRDGASSCPEENPPLGPGAPPGYRDLYLREGSTYTPLITAANFGASLPPDPSEFHLALLEASPDLHRVVFSTESGTYEWNDGPITPATGGGGGFTPPGAIAVLGASPDESIVFYVAGDGLYRWQDGATTKILTAAPSHLPPASGPAAVADGGARLFFTSPDPLLPADTDGRPDAYEWEAQGTGSCTAAPGCLGLLSSGRLGEATFAAASASGEDAYFTTTTSLVPSDPGSIDLYDARVGGGFPEPEAEIPCEGDACQNLPPEPVDPALDTLISGPGNPPVHFYNINPHKPRHHHRRRHHRHRRHHHRAHRRAGRR